MLDRWESLVAIVILAIVASPFIWAFVKELVPDDDEGDGNE